MTWVCRKALNFTVELLNFFYLDLPTRHSLANFTEGQAGCQKVLNLASIFLSLVFEPPSFWKEATYLYQSLTFDAAMVELSVLPKYGAVWSTPSEE